MLELPKNIIRRSFLYDLVRPILQKKQYRAWLKNGRPAPAPSVECQRIVREYAIKFSINTLVETGTFLGDMVKAQKENFSKIFSVELDETLAKRAQRKFAKHRHIYIFHGNSVDVLPEIIKQISGTCLFWLDAHYSGGITAKGNVDTPIIQELRYLLDNRLDDDVVLIDDARCFVGQNDYPTIEKLKGLILKRRPGWDFEIKDDIIRAHKKI